MIAPMSSTIASVSSSGFSLGDACDAARASTPSAKAMSVAIGIPHPRPVSPPPAIGEVDQGGRHHAADRGHDRQGGHAEPPQLARDDLALDLEADHEEEQRHQPVVDPEVQILVEVDQGAETDR